MKVLASTGESSVATVYLGEFALNRWVEFVESVQPPFSKRDKWVIIVSSLFGCPIDCQICDAGGNYKGKLTSDEVFAQIDFLVDRDFPNRMVPVKKFKIQFARMGEPSLNEAVLKVLEELPGHYQAPGLMPSISTVAPKGRDHFFSELGRIKDSLYANGHFQLQFSLHTTDEKLRKKIIPAQIWDFSQIAVFGESFFKPGDRKITLNFALSADAPLQGMELIKFFDPDIFFIKITPINPTVKVMEKKIKSALNGEAGPKRYPIVDELEDLGYQVLLSIGELEENRIGSNCGQLIKRYLEKNCQAKESYQYPLAQWPGESDL